MTSALVHASGVTGHSGPYPVAGAVLRARGRTAGVEAEGRDQAPASVDQPKLSAGSWVRPGGVVIERTFAEALGVGVGDRVTLNGRPFTVAGIAVTAASPPYPNLCNTRCQLSSPPNMPQLPRNDLGLAWVTQLDARALASSGGPPSYVLNLKLKDPATAPAFASKYGSNSSAHAHQPRAPGLALRGALNRYGGEPPSGRLEPWTWVSAARWPISTTSTGAATRRQ